MKNADKRNFKKNGIIIVIVLAVVFGLAGGVVGELLARAYLLNSFYSFPFFGEIDFSNKEGTNLVIRGAKKVIVEQDTKVNEIIDSVSSSLVGIFKKHPPQSKASSIEEVTKIKKDFNLANYYQLNQAVGQGFIITSDGWIITSYKTDKLTDYVVITNDGKIYDIDRVISDSLTSFYFLHVAQANDLPVRKFTLQNEIKNGRIVLAASWGGKSWLTRIFDAGSLIGSTGQVSLINSSDAFFSELGLTDDLPAEFRGSTLFNLAGEVVGLIDNQGRKVPINQLESAISSLLKNKEIKRASLGVNYIDLSRLLGEEAEHDKGAIIYKNAKGIAVVKKSVASLAGLKEGDIIISVEAVKIDKNNNLTDVIQQFIAGDKVNIVYLRDGEEKEVEVELGEVK